jgi:predicted nucleic acid-binding protein
MILLDPHVTLELMKTRPSDAVVAWLNGQASEKLFVSAITIGEVAYGLRILPDDKRRSGLRERFVAVAFDQRVLAYDESAARICGELMGDRKELGLPMSVPDGQIAAIARLNHLAVATRNVLDFEHCGIDVLNPFEASS